jgi:putative ATP-binding cassette transporter
VRILFFLLQTSRRDIVLAVLAGIVAGLGASGFALVLQNGIASRGEHLLAHVCAFAACWIAYGAGTILTSNRINRVAQRAIRKLRLDLSRQILEVPLPTLERDGQRIFPVLTEDIHTIASAVESLPSVMTGTVTILGCVAVFATISIPLTLACLGLLLVALLGYYLPLRKFMHHHARWRAEWDRIAVHIDALTNGHKEMLLDARKRRAFFTRHFEPSCRRQETEMVPAATWDTLFSRWGELLLLLGIGGLLFTLPWHGLATYEQFGQFMFVALFVLAPLGTVAGFVPRLGRLNIAIARASDIGLLLAHASKSHVADAPILPAPAIFPALRLDAVTCERQREGGPSFHLGPISLTFDRPEIVFVCGGNGSGKTTLLKLLCGLYPATSGTISMGDTMLSAATLAAHRQHFGAVFSDLYLFSTLLGYEDADPAKANELLRRMALEGTVALGPNGEFSTTALSQGQRKRLALVAALLEDKPIYVFDEWAADQDPEYRRLFYHQILPSLREQGRLVIAITHDESYFSTADRIVHLVEGHTV